MRALSVPRFVRLGGDHTRAEDLVRRPDGPRDFRRPPRAPRKRASFLFPDDDDEKTASRSFVSSVSPSPSPSALGSRRSSSHSRSGCDGARACVSVPSGATFSARRTSLCLDAVSGWYRAPFERDVRASPGNGADREHHQTRHHHPDRQPHRWSVRGGRLSPPAAAEQRRVLRSWRSRHRTSDPRGVARLQYHWCAASHRSAASLLFAIRRIFRRFTRRHL